MVRAGGSAFRTINDSDTPDPGGGHHPAWKRPKDDTHRPRWTPNAHGFPVALGSLNPAEKNRRDRVIPDSASVVVEQNSNLDPLWRSERDGSHQAPLGRNVRAPPQGMRPAGTSGPARRVAPVKRNVPAVVADPPVPTAAGVTFSAVAEVHMSASVSEEDSLVAQADEAFSSEDRPGRYTYGGGSGPETVSVFGSGCISGQ